MRTEEEEVGEEDSTFHGGGSDDNTTVARSERGWTEWTFESDSKLAECHQ